MKPATLALLKHELLVAEHAVQRRSQLGLPNITDVALIKFRGQSRPGGALVWGEALVATRAIASVDGEDRIIDHDVIIAYEVDCYHDKQPDLRVRIRPSA
jgi:hypothetical protein